MEVVVLATMVLLGALIPTSTMIIAVMPTTMAVQVDRLAWQLEAQGERVLIVLPERYLRPCVPNSARTKRGKVRSTCFPAYFTLFFLVLRTWLASMPLPTTAPGNLGNHPLSS